MLFRKKIQKQCQYCTQCVQLDEEHMLCRRKGVVLALGKCMHFKYDPCKRIPRKSRALDLGKYDEEDFSL